MVGTLFAIRDVKIYIMKNIFLLSVLLSMSFFLANGQEFGIKAGLNVATLNREVDVTDYNSKIGFHAGGLAHLHINSNFAIQPEVVYSSQGTKWKNAGTETKLNLGYINVPVLLQYMFSNGFRLQTGPQAGFLISAESKVNDAEVNVKDGYKTFDFSWVGGIGYLSSVGLGVDARYNLGLTDIIENNTNDANNRVFQVGLFYQFGHHKR